MKSRALGGIVLYGIAGLCATALSFWISSQFMGKAFSQVTAEPAPVPPSETAPAVVTAPAPPPPAPPTSGIGVTPTNMNTLNPPPPVMPGAAIGGIPPGPALPSGIPQVGSQSQIETIVSDKKGKFVNQSPNGESKIPDLLVGIIEDYDYTPAGKRDPFTPFERDTNTTTIGPVWPLQKYDLEQLKLVGVIWEVKVPKAMILDPTGKGYVVTINERIGRNNGYIARIREGEIVVVENIIGADGKATYVTKLMKLHPQ